MPEAEDGMTHKRTGREVYDALREQGQGHPREYKAREVCFDALALRLNETAVAQRQPRRGGASSNG
jgi:hypothetical protein